MTRYDDYPEHPLYGVPQEILDAARAVLAEAAEWNDVSPSLAEPIADAVIIGILGAGYSIVKEER